jgi:hypothetical protein
MSDLKKAAQQALEALEGCVKALDALHAPGDSIYTRASDLADRAEIALRAALAQQQEQEPVAWRYKGMMSMPWSLSDDGYYVSRKRDKGYTVEPLFTHPPRREWQSLSEEEIDAVLFPYCDNKYEWIDYREVACAVEQACKERNT